MSEATNEPIDKFDAPKTIKNLLHENHDESGKEEEKIGHNINTNLLLLGQQVYLWGRNGATQDKINHLLDEGVKALRGWYPDNLVMQNLQKGLKQVVELGGDPKDSIYHSILQRYQNPLSET